MKFSKEKFEKNAPKSILKIISEEHRNALEGKEVDFTDGYGNIDYTVNDKNFYLYPVNEDWCID